jgi:NodT family efflux transporter outer membrane factor (OMF) lipoprotein
MLLLFVCISMILLLAGAGCTVPRATQADRRFDMPARFDERTDTLSSAELGRKLFYSSPYLGMLLDSVLTNNYDLQMAAQRIREAQARLLRSRAPLIPQVNGAITPSVRKFGLYTMDGAGNIVTDIEPNKRVPVNLPDFYYGFQASWEVDLWGKLRNGKKAATARFLASAEGRRLMETALIAETAGAYYELQSDDQVLRLLDETIRIQEQAIDMVRVQKQAAVVNELAVQQFEAQLLNMKSLRVEMQQKIIEHESRINFLAGRFPQHIDRDSSFFTQSAIPVIQAGVPSALLRNRPDVRQSEWELQAARADLAAARAAFFPSLMLTGGAGFQAYRHGLIFTMPESIAYSVIAGLTAPVINRRVIRSEFDGADARQMEALYQYRKTIARGFFEVYQELNNIRNLAQVYEIKRRETTLLAASIQVSSELFRTGRADYLEVLIARQNALRANIELINIRKNQYLATLNLFRALGGGWRN